MILKRQLSASAPGLGELVVRRAMLLVGGGIGGRLRIWLL